MLTGPSCGSADGLYENHPILLPLRSRSGDKVVIHNTNACTSAFPSVGFNGFPPRDVIVP